jgi:hypothetical protein
VAWIAPQVPHILEELGKLALKLEGFLLDTIPILQGKLAAWGNEFVVWLNDQHLGSKLMAALGRLWTALIRPWLEDRVFDLETKLADWAHAFINWPAKVVTDLPGELSRVLATINEWVDSILPRLLSKGEQMGASILHGFTNGLGSIAGQVIGGIGGFLGGNAPTSSGRAPTVAPPAASISLSPSFAPSAVSSSLAPAGTTVINVHVAGSITTARGMAEDVRTELLRLKRQGVTIGLA